MLENIRYDVLADLFAVTLGKRRERALCLHQRRIHRSRCTERLGSTGQRLAPAQKCGVRARGKEDRILADRQTVIRKKTVDKCRKCRRVPRLRAEGSTCET